MFRLIVGTSTSPPDPHPIDFVWRFNNRTIDDVSSLLPAGERILAVGTPSIARRLELLNRDVILVDHQPLQGVRNHLVLEVGERLLKPGFGRLAIIDPPWYLPDMLLWLNWTAHVIGRRGTIYFPAWPQEMRPDAALELAEITSHLSNLGEVTETGTILEYDTPRFELNAGALGDGPLSESPRLGRLMRWDFHVVPAFEFRRISKRWHRFVINNYQIAITLKKSSIPCRAFQVPGSKGRFWPYVSRRAPNRENISVWSSENEVGCTNYPENIISYVRDRALYNSVGQNQVMSAEIRNMTSWSLPSEDIWRFCEWQQ